MYTECRLLWPNASFLDINICLEYNLEDLYS